MKLLLYSANFAPELIGIGKYSGEMAAMLAAQGHEVRVVAAPPYYPLWKVGAGYHAWRYRREEIGGIKVWRAPIWIPQAPGGLARVLHLVTFALSSVPLMLRQALWKPDVVMTVAPAFVCAPMGWLTARLCGAKAWLHVQDYEVDVAFRVGLLREGWMSRVVRPVERFLFRRFDTVSSISLPMLTQALTKGVAPKKLRFLPNWVDLDAIKPAERDGAYRRELGLTPEHVVALYSGSFGRKHGLMMIPEMARRLQSHAQLVFVICGDGVMKEELEAACADLGNTRLLPLQPSDRLCDLLAMADIHLLPQGDGVEDLVLPSKLSGMVASGRPVVATCRPETEMARVVSACGLIVEPGNVAALASAVLSLAEQPAQRAALGRQARHHAEEHLGCAKILGRLGADLQALATGTHAAAPALPEAAAHIALQERAAVGASAAALPARAPSHGMPLQPVRGLGRWRLRRNRRQPVEPILALLARQEERPIEVSDN